MFDLKALVNALTALGCPITSDNFFGESDVSVRRDNIVVKGTLEEETENFIRLRGFKIQDKPHFRGTKYPMGSIHKSEIRLLYLLEQ